MLEPNEEEKTMKSLIFLLTMMMGISGVALADGHLAGEEEHDMGDHASTMQDVDPEPEMSGDDPEDSEPEDPQPEDPQPEDPEPEAEE
tara:strand:+ start:108 stop:371 length:264 start_codon:yes stop_codon:yes gene_type:complete